METLDNTEWDVVISGTGLPQSLLALALSRSGKKVLHIDHNDYYGGDEAAFSLTEAEGWARKHSNSTSEQSVFSKAAVRTLEVNDAVKSKLGTPRAYSFALAPQLIYTRSNLLQALVSSRTHSQLDFQAVGSWFAVVNDQNDPDAAPRLIRVPSGREDVFRDATLDLRAKRSLMRFIRFVGSYDEDGEREKWVQFREQPVHSCLRDQFSLPDAAIEALLALALPPYANIEPTMATVVPRVRQHLQSIGVFGAGFAAVLPKWGGLAEIAQVACRACAVGGGVYVLGKGITNATKSEVGVTLELSPGEKIKTQWLVGCSKDLPTSGSYTSDLKDNSGAIAKRVAVISSPLTSLFPPTSEGGPLPAGAVVVAKSATSPRATVQILAHSSESGECPTGQCVLYATSTGSDGLDVIDEAISSLLRSIGEEPVPDILWRMDYVQTSHDQSDNGLSVDGPIVTLPSLSIDAVYEDKLLNSTKEVWQMITGGSEGAFMKFEPREGIDEDEADDG
ncbi:hypothetical protein BAUCODRAFT_35856 [Baudoinia panamericana UAMH 10762]|uniref:Rab proteins geranylgeranyltransferase n=1 Tax=Baudoinia panamericana (strain UAMH 10762) TaxID=717646 RepID=M2N756_BAUPA|nr:uncharacterized protein BAUCODRAFT_35856 [Baudoinia panamericana UAMH 10762]EMC94620.1 hypothetical protein BAUCODRAFT_35856 [Baudoinia panamericana UAMH 10762]